MDNHQAASHSHTHKSPESRLAKALAITLVVFVVEAAGGILSNSLALLSDAGHVITDALALTLSLVAARMSRLPQSNRATYGYHRVGILAAALNGLALIAIAGLIFRESYHRLISPPPVDLSVMMPIAVLGFAANLIMAGILSHGHNDLNVKSAWLHVLGDTLSSAGVIVSGVVLWLTGWRYADPIAGFVIGCVIIIGGGRVAWEAVVIFLDLAPPGYDIGRIAGEIASVSGVKGVHDIHIRQLVHGNVHFTAHVRLDDCPLSEADTIRRAIEEKLCSQGIRHITIQMETEPHGGLYCEACAPSISPATAHEHDDGAAH